MNKLYFLLLLPLIGCEPRPPERDPCYVEADARALSAYLEKCSGYSSTRDCPAGEAIERQHGEDLAGCP